MPVSNLSQEIAIDQAKHNIYLQQKAEIEALRILLAIANRKFVPVTSKFRLVDIFKRYPKLAEAYENTTNTPF